MGDYERAPPTRVEGRNGRHVRAAAAEAETWERAEEAARVPERERTDADKEMIAWAVGEHESVEVETVTWVKKLVGAEEIRRKAAGDEDSPARYHGALGEAVRDALTDGSDAWRAEQMLKAVLQRRPLSPARQWAELLNLTFRGHMVDFALRRDLEKDGVRQYDGNGRLSRLAASLDALQAEAARLCVPDQAEPAEDDVRDEDVDQVSLDDESDDIDGSDPIPDVTPEPVREAERWEPQWGPEEDAAMREWAESDRPDTDTPVCFTRTFNRDMEAAIEREKTRRVDIDDGPANEVLEKKRALFKRRRYRRESVRKVVLRGATGFWPLVQPDLANLVRVFLRGGDIERLYGHGPRLRVVGDAEDEQEAG